MSYLFVVDIFGVLEVILKDDNQTSNKVEHVSHGFSVILSSELTKSFNDWLEEGEWGLFGMLFE